MIGTSATYYNARAGLQAAAAAQAQAGGPQVLSNGSSTQGETSAREVTESVILSTQARKEMGGQPNGAKPKGAGQEMLTLSPAAQKLVESKPSMVEKAVADPAVARRLAAFPEPFQQAVRGLNDNQFKLVGGERGSDTDRDRFVSGKAMGGMVNVFDHVHQRVTDARVKQKQINPAEERGLHGLVDQLEKFTPEQRKEVLSILDAVRG